MRGRVALCGCALALAWSLAPRLARAADPIEGTRSLALGDSLRGLATGAEGVLLNPSGIAMSKQYTVSALYSLRVQDVGSAVHISVTDSVTQPKVAVGLYYNFIYESPHVTLQVPEGTSALNGRLFVLRDATLTREGHEVGLTTAFPLGSRFAFGVTMKYTYFSLTTPLASQALPANFMPTNPSINSNLSYDLNSAGNAVTFDAGLTLRVLQPLTLGVVGQNLWPHGYESPAILGIGLVYMASQSFLLAADAAINFTGFQTCTDVPPPPLSLAYCQNTRDRTVVKVGGGAEYLIAQKVPLRAGYLFDSNLSAHSVTGGIGFLDPSSFGVDFAFRERVAGGKETLLLLGLRILRN